LSRLFLNPSFFLLFLFLSSASLGFFLSAILFFSTSFLFFLFLLASSPLLLAFLF